MKERDAQRACDNRQEPDPDVRNWREIPDDEPLEGEDLFHELVDALRERRRRETDGSNHT